MFFGNKRFNHNYDFKAEQNKLKNQSIRNRINKLLEEESSGKSIIWSFRERDLQSIASEINSAKRFNNIDNFVLDSDLEFEYQRLKKQCEDHLEQDRLEKEKSYNNKIKKLIVDLLKYEQTYGRNMWETHTASCKTTLNLIDGYVSDARLACDWKFSMDKELLAEYQRFKVQYDEYLQNKKKEEAKKSYDNMSIDEIKLRLEDEKKLKEQEEREKIIEQRKKEAEIQKKREEERKIQEEARLKREEEARRQYEEEQKRLEEERKKEEEIRLQIKLLEQKILNQQQSVVNECQQKLAESKYSDFGLDLLLEIPSYSYNFYGYTQGKVFAKKDNADYSVSFKLNERIPYEIGLNLLKLINQTLSIVDITNVDSRAIKIKNVLGSAGVTIQKLEQNIEFSNNYLSIVITYQNYQVFVKYYTSRISISQLDFDTLEGHKFETFCAELLRKNGFERVNVTQGSGDQGIDILAFRDGIKYGIQCKCYSTDIGNKAVQEVYAGKTFYECHVGVVLTNQFFTKSAVELAKKNGIILWDRNKLLEMINKANNY